MPRIPIMTLFQRDWKQLGEARSVSHQRWAPGHTRHSTLGRKIQQRINSTVKLPRPQVPQSTISSSLDQYDPDQEKL